MSTPPDLSTIVRAAIHPAIGVARVGNAPSAWFIGPELVDPPAEAPGYYRDATGALKRQAARFRVYGYDAQGRVVAELNAGNAAIAWRVHLANLKAAWYEFSQALDIPESAQQGRVSRRRNATLQGAAREALAIDGGAVGISGSNQAGGTFKGQFLGEPVYLGELRTDEAGRLVVLGGVGRSDSPTNAPLPNFANNDGWHDDTADGPVTASVVLQGRTLPVDPAWVVVAPPNYAPQLKSVRTLHDLVQDVFHPADPNASVLPVVSFQRDVLPIFRRMSALQWSNQGFSDAFGHGAVMDFMDPDFLAWASVPLREPIDLYAERRRQIANAFRDVERDGYSPTPLPWLYGDAIDLPVPPTPHVYTALSSQQLQALQAWARGRFTGDWDPHAQGPAHLDDVPLAEQPAMLDRAALDFCLADAFHPGCEVTWPMRHASIYSAPGRIAHAPANTPQPDYGDQLTPQNILGPDGPLNAQWPGGLTRWMAVPWQTDTASCLSGYIPAYDPYLPTFWPARVPNHVLDEPEYEAVVNTSLPRAERLAAFKIRRSWPGVLPGATHEEQCAAMVTLFPKMGIIEERPGVVDDPDLPARMQVARLPDFGPLDLVTPETAAAEDAAPGAATPATRAAARRAPTGRGVAPSRDGTWLGRFRGPRQP